MRALLLLPLLGSVLSAELFCPQIDAEFRRSAQASNKTVACRCQEDGFYYQVRGATIECSDTVVPAMMRTLSTLNDTAVGSVRIWNSKLHKLSGDMLKKVKFEHLSIEESDLGMVQDQALSHVASRLNSLSLRRNMLNEQIFSQLKAMKKLKKLDLSGNKIGSVKKGIFPDEITELFLDQNEIRLVEDGAFENLRSLKKLSIANNQLTTITKDTFKGLDQLEMLQLHHNRIGSIDPAAFNHMKKLRVIDLGTNQVSEIHLRGLPRLEKVFLNNNKIFSFKEVVFKDLPAAVLISMDRNSISEVDDGDLIGLARSGKLESLTLAANNISYIAPRALAPIQYVSILALQNNQIDRFSDEGKPSFLQPLRRLQTLLLSHNVVRQIKEKDLPKTIRVFAADHNKLEEIDAKAFDGIPVERFYINNNALTHLERHIFDSFDMDTLEAVDITDNKWACVCGKEWLVDWLDNIGEQRDVGEGVLGCLARKECALSASERKEEEEAEARRSTWISIAASVLAVASIVILLFIAYFFVTDGKHTTLFLRPRRVGSDTQKLFSDMDASLLPSETDSSDPKRPQSAERKKHVTFAQQ